MANIVIITDMDEDSSGYKNLCTPLLIGLADLDHNIKVAGMGYKGKEHDLPFSIFPAETIQDLHAVAYNLRWVQRVDVFIVAMDIPLQQFFYENLKGIFKRIPQEIEQGITTDIKYIAITPLENGPLTMSWAATLLNMDSVFFISELGKQEAIKAGISKADHLFIGIDSVFWHPATPTEKKTLREGLGIGQDEFVVLTVADNQERKNLWAGMESVRLLKQQTDRKVRYIIVTRKESPVGWRLDDFALEMGLVKELMTFNKGIPTQDLWGLYAVADVYLQPSKAEGLGMPVLEAMACGIPCVATDTGALHELLEQERGYLISCAYWLRDVWGNEIRHFIDTSKCAGVLNSILQNSNDKTINNALEYVRNRTWGIAINQTDLKIKELQNGTT
jgi:glycosyltransferase involved in cell wall biosynthesis